MANSKPKLTPRERFERLASQAGKFPNMPAVIEAIIALNEKTVRKMLEHYHSLPEGQRKALGIGAKLILSVLESRLDKKDFEHRLELLAKAADKLRRRRRKREGAGASVKK